MSEGKQEARTQLWASEAQMKLIWAHWNHVAAKFIGDAELWPCIEAIAQIMFRQANQPQEARIQHVWGCPAWSSGDDSECDDICGATSRAKGNGEGKPSASTSSPSQPQEKAQPESGEMEQRQREIDVARTEAHCAGQQYGFQRGQQAMAEKAAQQAATTIGEIFREYDGKPPCEIVEKYVLRAIHSLGESNG